MACPPDGHRYLGGHRHPAELAVRIEPVTEEQAQLARLAYRRFGKGNHAAGLNLGDCFAYALALATGEPLLCKGNDFTQTDITLC